LDLFKWVERRRIRDAFFYAVSNLSMHGAHGVLFSVFGLGSLPIVKLSCGPGDR
jgi:hypothetical protein